MRKSRNRNIVLLVLILLVLTGGCKKKEAPAPPPVANPQQLQPKPVQQQVTSAKALSTQGPQIDFSAKRDPFKPFIAEVKKPTAGTKSSGGLPIQNHELSQFRVTGIIVGLKENIAQVLDPTGKAYTLKKGMVIGRENGRVTNITSSYIEVQEKYREESGKVKSRTVRLSIPKKN